MAEVRQTILSLKNYSAGWADFPALVAKQSIKSYIEPFTFLINRSFLEGTFPTELKLARVVPILYQVTAMFLVIIDPYRF